MLTSVAAIFGLAILLPTLIVGDSRFSKSTEQKKVYANSEENSLSGRKAKSLENEALGNLVNKIEDEENRVEKEANAGTDDQAIIQKSEGEFGIEEGQAQGLDIDQLADAKDEEVEKDVLDAVNVPSELTLDTDQQVQEESIKDEGESIDNANEPNIQKEESANVQDQAPLIEEVLDDQEILGDANQNSPANTQGRELSEESLPHLASHSSASGVLSRNHEDSHLDDPLEQLAEPVESLVHHHHISDEALSAIPERQDSRLPSLVHTVQDHQPPSPYQLDQHSVHIPTEPLHPHKPHGHASDHPHADGLPGAHTFKSSAHPANPHAPHLGLLGHAAHKNHGDHPKINVLNHAKMFEKHNSMASLHDLIPILVQHTKLNAQGKVTIPRYQPDRKNKSKILVQEEKKLAASFNKYIQEVKKQKIDESNQLINAKWSIVVFKFFLRVFNNQKSGKEDKNFKSSIEKFEQLAVNITNKNLFLKEHAGVSYEKLPYIDLAAFSMLEPHSYFGQIPKMCHDLKRDDNLCSIAILIALVLEDVFVTSANNIMVCFLNEGNSPWLKTAANKLHKLHTDYISHVNSDIPRDLANSVWAEKLLKGILKKYDSLKGSLQTTGKEKAPLNTLHTSLMSLIKRVEKHSDSLKKKHPKSAVESKEVNVEDFFHKHQ